MCRERRSVPVLAAPRQNGAATGPFPEVLATTDRRAAKENCVLKGPGRNGKNAETDRNPLPVQCLYFVAPIGAEFGQIQEMPSTSAVSVTINRERGMIPPASRYREILLWQFLLRLFA